MTDVRPLLRAVGFDTDVDTGRCGGGGCDEEGGPSSSQLASARGSSAAWSCNFGRCTDEGEDGSDGECEAGPAAAPRRRRGAVTDIGAMLKSLGYEHDAQSAANVPPQSHEVNR